MRNLLFLFVLLLLSACKGGSDKEVYQSSRDNIINVKSLIKEINLDDLLIGSISEPYCMGDFLVIGDYKSTDKMIHLFDGKSYEYLTSFGKFGQGPDEITILGSMAWNKMMNEIYVTDHGKLQIFGFHMDSIMNNADYTPFVKTKLNASSFPNDYTYINDSLSYGTFISVTSPSTFTQSAGTWNMK
ncbi:MAG: 6-bladed beta-propeller, partial [Bacteroides sp.]